MSALQQYCSEVENLFGIECHFQCEKPVLIRDATVATHLYHVAQEAVNNAIKHARATIILIQLTAGEREGTLIVKDDGIGIGKRNEPHQGVGLQIMNYRAGMIAGNLEIRCEPSRGTAVICRFPIASDRREGKP